MLKKKPQSILILLFSMFTPALTSAQSNDWQVNEEEATIVVYELPKLSANSTLIQPQPRSSTAVQTPPFTTSPPRKVPHPNNQLVCNHFSWWTGLGLEMAKGDSTIKLNYMEKCDQSVTKTMVFKAQQPGEPDAMQWYEGTLTRNEEVFSMLDGQTSLELLDGQKPFRYRLTFTMRFAPRQDFIRFLDGHTVDETRVIEIRGQTTFAPFVSCKSKVTAHSYDSNVDDIYQAVDQLWCYPFVGRVTP